MRILLALACMALPASADEVVLRNGAVFEGVVHESGDRVVVKMPVGTMSFRKIDVKSIRRTDDPLTVFERKSAEAATSDARVELASWARENGLEKKAQGLLERVIEDEPDHAGARRALGYERHEGRWMRFDELMLSKGFVKVGDGWQPKDSVEAQKARESTERLEAARRAEEAKAREALDHLERERLALERQKLLTLKELQMQKIVLERDRLEALRRADRVWDPYYGRWDCAPFNWAPSAPVILPVPTPAHHPGHALPRPVPTGPTPLWTPPVR